MSSGITIIIPTTGKSNTIHRTLMSLVKCKIPSNLRQTVIVENGSNPKGNSLLSKLTQEFNPKYIYVAEGNKSNALNVALETVNGGLALFFDDDIRIHEDTLMAYGQVLDDDLRGCFFAGPTGVDYDDPPCSWLVPYLPASAKGWYLGNNRLEFFTPDALGFNWAAFVCDLKEVGLFNKKKGPGSGARGQETDMQTRLINHGINGFYLPEAKVWHYVPADRSNPSWLLNRKVESGRRKAIDFRGNKIFNYLKIKLYLYISVIVVFVLDNLKMNLEIGFKWRLRKRSYLGMLDVLGRGKASKVCR